MRMGIGEILVILVVVLLIFGANKIPQLGDALGKGIRNFKKATKEDDAIDVTPKPDAAQRGQIPSGAATGSTASQARSDRKA
ncbi:MAG: twin-arginine translocase TatA/TatE family subunit [Deltaproteobacteria bacterium]|nr:twin-arginine translocase TatA/TatE family subunit [Deltaproteobacteria bacterium]